MKINAPSNHNIPEAALKILGALHYYDLTPMRIEEQVREKLAARPSERFSMYECNGAMISIASSAVGSPITVTIAKALTDGRSEEILFHYDPVKKSLLTARQMEDA